MAPLHEGNISLALEKVSNFRKWLARRVQTSGHGNKTSMDSEVAPHNSRSSNTLS